MGVSSDQTFDESEECGFPFDVGGASEIVVVVFLDYVAAWTEFEFWTFGVRVLRGEVDHGQI